MIHETRFTIPSTVFHSTFTLPSTSVSGVSVLLPHLNEPETKQSTINRITNPVIILSSLSAQWVEMLRGTAAGKSTETGPSHLVLPRFSCNPHLGQEINDHMNYGSLRNLSTQPYQSTYQFSSLFSPFPSFAFHALFSSYCAPAALSPATLLRITDVSSLKWLACHSQMPGDRRQLWFYGFTRCPLGANPHWEGALHGLPSSSVPLWAHWGHTVNIFSVRLDRMRQGREEAALTHCKLRF
ncbi:hypothetical protein AOLI_G00006770 [Acnodon oligacanthus]